MRSGSARQQPEPGWGRAAAALRGTRRLLIVAGLAAVLVASLAAAAVAGVFTAGGTPAHGAPAVSAARGTAVQREAAARRPVAVRAAARTASGRLRTSCTTVGHIGDSTSVGMVSPVWLPDPAQRLAAQYADVGVRRLRVGASGGRSIVEEMPGQLNGDIVARNWQAAGFRGCWVLALGTNDTANVSVGASVGRMARIREMMGVAHGEPVLWVNTQTDLSSGPWAEANMRLWNQDLVRACAAFPNMRVFNWAGQVQPGWHLPDGIHYTSAGYAIRARAIARGLARAFPQNGRSKGCIVG